MNDGHPVSIRWAIQSDIDEILDIERESFDSPCTEKEIRAFQRKREGIIRVALAPEGVVGHLFYENLPKAIHIVNIAVRPSHRRLKIGTQLIQQLMDTSKSMAHRKKFIHLAVSEENTRAHLFFKSLGFKATGINRGYYATGQDAYEFVYRFSKKKDLSEL